MTNSSIDPMDPLFAKITTLFIQLQTQTFGTDHYYNTDLFNEEEPPTNNPAYLSSVGKAAYDAIMAVIFFPSLLSFLLMQN